MVSLAVELEGAALLEVMLLEAKASWKVETGWEEVYCGERSVRRSCGARSCCGAHSARGMCVVDVVDQTVVVEHAAPNVVVEHRFDAPTVNELTRAQIAHSRAVWGNPITRTTRSQSAWTETHPDPPAAPPLPGVKTPPPLQECVPKGWRCWCSGVNDLHTVLCTICGTARNEQCELVADLETDSFPDELDVSLSAEVI